MAKRAGPRKLLPLLVFAALALGLLAAGCGDSDDGETTAAAPAESPEPAEETTAVEEQAEGEQADEKASKPKPKGTEISTADSQFGAVLFGAKDRAIYIFDKEQTSESECFGDCAVEWPPVLTDGRPEAKGDVKQGKLGTTERKDGTTQVTYDGQPLYYYFDDPAGVVGCHNVPGFGGLWLAIDSAGNPV